MKKPLQIIILLLFASCGLNTSNVNSIADDSFKLCSDIRYNKLIMDYGPIEGKMIYKKNIHSLLENLLLRKKYLTEISKQELGFNPTNLFPRNSFLSCYGYLFEQLKILDKSDKTTWQYKFCINYNKFEAYGNLNLENNHIIDALNEIPQSKFEKIMYRKIFLDLIFMKVD
ncbi:MAG: hypothetical protein ACTHXJ_02890 [Mesonia sp.]